MNNREHWEHVYGTKSTDQVSWYRPHLETSLALIERAAPDRSSRIIDVGGGASTLVDDLIAGGYRSPTVLDISRTALGVAKTRMGDAGNSVDWIVGDVLDVELPEYRYDVWHDRAVFHFLTNPADRAEYARQARKSIKPGGHVVICAFGPEGPDKCSGLDVKRYEAEALRAELGTSFQLVEHLKEVHHTPFGTTQQFVYCCFR